MTTHGGADPFLTKAALADAVKRYLGSRDPHDAAASPLYGNVAGLPPIRIDVGDQEILLDDSVRYFERLVEASGEGELHIWEGLPHVFPVLNGTLAAAEVALNDIGSFLRDHLGLKQPVAV